MTLRDRQEKIAALAATLERMQAAMVQAQAALAGLYRETVPPVESGQDRATRRVEMAIGPHGQVLRVVGRDDGEIRTNSEAAEKGAGGASR